MKKIIYFIIIALIAYFIGDAVMTQMNKSDAKAHRLPCQEQSTTFERVYSHESLDEIKSAVYANNLDIKIKLKPSVYMKSKLFDFISKDDILKIVQTSLNRHKKEVSSSKSAILDVLVYENDKKDPGKKTKKSKLYEGYVILSFILDNTLIYRIQIDFLKPKAEDLGEKVECGIISFLTSK